MQLYRPSNRCFCSLNQLLRGYVRLLRYRATGELISSEEDLIINDITKKETSFQSDKNNFSNIQSMS